MKTNRSKLAALLATLPLAAFFALAGCSEAESAGEDGPPEIALVERRDLDIRVEAAGNIEPIRVVEVKSKASGEVLRLHAETGTRAPRGALLAEIDPRDVRNALAQAEADLAVARERLATSEAQRRRTAELREASVVTEQEFEAAALDQANAQAQLIKARTNLELARERMGDVTIRAPIDGTVIEKTIEVGQIIASASQNISGGTTLLKMADLSQMQVRTLIDETDIGRVGPGQSATVSVEAYPGRPFIGEVMKIEPQAIAEQNVTMFPVLVRLSNEEGLLRPGMNAEVVIEVARRDDVVAVPNNAVVSLRDMTAAAAALGIDEDAARAAMRRNRAGSNGGNDGAAPAAVPRDTAAPAADGAAASADECAALRDRLRGGALADLTEAERALLQRCRAQFGGGRAGARTAEAEAGSGAARPGIVFVSTDAGPEPRMVLLGLNDWDYTEVIRGLEPGERVVMISVARMQAQQQQFENRMRERAGGNMFGTPAGGQSGQARRPGR